MECAGSGFAVFNGSARIRRRRCPGKLDNSGHVVPGQRFYRYFSRPLLDIRLEIFDSSRLVPGSCCGRCLLGYHGKPHTCHTSGRLDTGDSNRRLLSPDRTELDVPNLFLQDTLVLASAAGLALHVGWHPEIVYPSLNSFFQPQTHVGSMILVIWGWSMALQILREEQQSGTVRRRLATLYGALCLLRRDEQHPVLPTHAGFAHYRSRDRMLFGTSDLSAMFAACGTGMAGGRNRSNPESRSVHDHRFDSSERHWI